MTPLPPACFGPEASDAVVTGALRKAPAAAEEIAAAASASTDRPLPVPLALSAAAEEYRRNYREFRKGNARGAKGDTSADALAAATTTKATHRRTASGGASPLQPNCAQLAAAARVGVALQLPTAQPSASQQFDLMAALRGPFARGRDEKKGGSKGARSDTRTGST